MADWLLSNEQTIRLVSYAGVMGIMLLLEAVFARRNRTAPRLHRWINNLGIAALNSVLLGLLVPVLAVGMAMIAADRGWGLFNLVALPVWIEVTLAIILLDFAIWAQHVIFHKVPPLWRLHAMHHVDRDLDATSGVRFHPVEILLSMLLKLGLVILIGPAAVAVMLFEVILNASAIFNHANLRLPRTVDAVLRTVIVTPDMHRIHHSPNVIETDSNYGFWLSFWDRLWGTYRAQPLQDHENMTLGLDEAPELDDTLYLKMVTLPLWLGRDKG